MILSPISYLDCIVFCIFLAPQLVIHVGLFETIAVVLQCLPFLLLELPYSFIRERYFSKRGDQSPFVQQASPFEDFVIRCVRYAFANIHPSVGRVFFSKQVALPFLTFRMLRHGYIKSPVHWHEYKDKRFRGIWTIHDPTKRPDLCVYYAHGGGFSMGSSYFYLEFLLSWLDLLKKAGYRNPSIFALEYTLVPDDSFPGQLEEAIAGYEHVLSTVGNPGKVCVGGDSAGATIILNLLLHLANTGQHADVMNGIGQWQLPKPAFAVLISPWVSLVSDRHRNTRSDYLDAGNLHIYAEEYAGDDLSPHDPLLSPGQNRDVEWWRRATPDHGFFVAYGDEEVLAPETEGLVQFWKKGDIKVVDRGETGGIHAWPVASLFLSESNKRLKGLEAIVQEIRKNIK
ncbi:Alpha/Beta hydrolase protein [Xylaria bambusicola]|uniref:Alpha/Beta hydrolase protein n=1 Tax=Xylaria bambusicola TaxID=326684 RepID=UPI00200813E1|nr:Alpha/Beta hydrolase protein [Xylaria bambusicola]KAI0512654.1 Alpha/Beta hydrolase protein [Xylaria bambusicola]